jgi:hypothetical protein
MTCGEFLHKQREHRREAFSRLSEEEKAAAWESPCDWLTSELRGQMPYQDFTFPIRAAGQVTCTWLARSALVIVLKRNEKAVALDRHCHFLVLARGLQFSALLVSILVGLHQDKTRRCPYCGNLRASEIEASKRLGAFSSRKTTRNSAEYGPYRYSDRCARVRPFWPEASLQVVGYCNLGTR